jgi:hypothetical protein
VTDANYARDRAQLGRGHRIGDGIPLFDTLPGDIRLRHVATRHYPSGQVQSEYHVVDAPPVPGFLPVDEGNTEGERR